MGRERIPWATFVEYIGASRKMYEWDSERKEGLIGSWDGLIGSWEGLGGS